jgi:hypothetical protein
MNTREIAEEYRLSHWAGIMRERQESGLSIKAYCKRSGFHENVYFYWQRKLRIAASQELVTAMVEQGGKGTVPKGWAVCKESKAEGNSALSIEIGRFRVKAEGNFSAEQVEKVCRALMRLC